MLDYTMPLTAEESAFAAENHNMIQKFLCVRRLPMDEYYDIIVFGYLRAVRKYLARPDLQQYKFSPIANRAMSCDLYHSNEYWNRAKRRGEVVPLLEETDSRDLMDTVAERVDNVIAFEQLTRKITPMQRRIASLRADGYRDKEIATIFRISPREVTAEMEDAKFRVLNFQMEDAADMAA